MSDELKYAIKLPISSSLRDDLIARIDYAEKAGAIHLENWKRKKVESYRKGPLRWFRRNKTDAEILIEEVEKSDYFWGYDHIQWKVTPYAACPRTCELMQSIVNQSDTMESRGNTGYAYGNRDLFDYLTRDIPEMPKERQ